MAAKGFVSSHISDWFSAESDSQNQLILKAANDFAGRKMVSRMVYKQMFRSSSEELQEKDWFLQRDLELLYLT